jgi:hypothetical protein
MFPVLDSWNEFAGKPIEAPLTLLSRELLIGDTSEANNYGEHISEYNSTMAFVSIGVDSKPPYGNGPYCYRIHGQAYHLVLPFYPNVTNKPGYA